MSHSTPASASLERKSVHVWTLVLGDASGPNRARLTVDPRRVARQAAREILADYLQCEPNDLPVGRVGRGSPRLLGSSTDVRFSLAHSGGYALLAVARGRRIGVDLERLRGTRDIHEVAARFFGVGEVAALENLAGNEAVEAFFRTWVRKEAYLKGIGGTVPAHLRRFGTASASSDPVIAWTELEAGGVSAWALRDLPAPRGYVAAVAAEGALGRIEAFIRSAGSFGVSPSA